MAIDFKKTVIDGHSPEIWRGEAKILPGGFKPLQTFPIGTVLQRATLIHVDYKDGLTAAVVKTATVIKGSTTTKPRINKGHYFVVGDVITKFGDGKATPSIKSIDTSNTEYDEVTLNKAYTGLTEGDIIVESKEVESGDASPLYVPNMVLGAVKKFDGKGLPTLDVAYDCVVLSENTSNPIPTEWLNDWGGGCGSLKSNPNIIFIKQ